MMEFLRTSLGPISIGVVLLAVWFFLRTTATPLASIEDLDVLLAQSEPVVLEFFGNT